MRALLPLDVNADDGLILFLQNDDHIFIDIDSRVFCDSLAIVRDSPARFKSLYMSHWPEALRMIGKTHKTDGLPRRIGPVVAGNVTMLDAVQLFNLRYLKYIYDDVEWPNG